jgi:hypothetical protein
MRCRLAALTATLLLVACTPMGPVSQEVLTSGLQAGQRKSICAVSAVGDTFAVKKIGITVFGNEYTDVPIDSWRIDEHVTGKLASLLGQRFDFKRVTPDKETFAGLQQRDAIILASESKATAAVRRLAGTHKCDLYLVVTKSGHMIANTNQAVGGLGILHMGSVFFQTVNVHALTVVTIYDGRSFAVLSQRPAWMGQSGLTSVMGGPHRRLDLSAWPSPPQAAVNPTLREAVVTLLDQSLGMTLPEMLPTQ